MKIKIRTINQVAVVISLIFSVLNITVIILHHMPWWACAATAAITFPVTFVITKFFFRQYVIFRIKPLYQLLLSRDIATSRLSEELRKRVNDDVVTDIQTAIDHLISFNSSEIERLRQKDDERSNFLISVFHELKTPIFNIGGYTQTLLDGAIYDEQVNRRYLERTLRSVERLTDLIEDIEKLSKYESGGSVIYKGEFDIVDVVNEVFDANCVNLDARNITAKVDRMTFAPKKPIMVYADRLRISLAVEELVRNAIFFGKDGGSITISFLDMFDKVLVEVSDNGIGIPAKDLPHIFEQFYRVDKSRSREKGGLGLGLTGVKVIIEAHDENITVRSELGVGTTFSFTLLKKPTAEGDN